MATRSLVVAVALAALVGPTSAGQPTLRYEKPTGYAVSNGAHVETWVADGLDSVIQVYAFRPYQGDFRREFRRGLFRDRIAAAYQEDKLLAPPIFQAMAINGAESALAVSFTNFNGGAPREHLRVAILAAGLVAIVDISANSPEAFERNSPSVSRLLRSLHVVGVGL